MAIGYTPQTWVNGSAPSLSAANLQTMDNGINAACDALDTAATMAPIVATAIEAGTATTTPNDTDKLGGAKADHSMLYYTWANLKANIKTAIGYAAQAVGFTLAGGTSSKTLTVDADATISTLTKDQFSAAAAETTIADTDTFPKLVSGVLKQITWANIVVKIKAVLDIASDTVKGLIKIATLAMLEAGSDSTSAVPPSILRTWAMKRTKMPDGVTADYSRGTFVAADYGAGEWAAGSGALSVSSGALLNTAAGTALNHSRTTSLAIGKTILLKLKCTVAATVKVYIGDGTTLATSLSVGTTYSVFPIYVSVSTTVVKIAIESGIVAGNILYHDYIWMGTYSYLTGTLSEEAARFSNSIADLPGTAGAAFANIYIGSNVPANGNTFTVDGKVYTFRDAAYWASPGPAEGDILIVAGNAATSADYFCNALNRSNPGSYDGVRYKVAATHPTVSGISTNNPWQAFGLLARTAGNLGNQIPISSNITGWTAPATLLGGYSDSGAKIITEIQNNIAGGGTRPAAAKIDILVSGNIGFENAVDVASAGTTTLPAGGTWIWVCYGYGATISSAKKGTAAGGTTLTVAGANATVWYRRTA